MFQSVNDRKNEIEVLQRNNEECQKEIKDLQRDNEELKKEMDGMNKNQTNVSDYCSSIFFHKYSVRNPATYTAAICRRKPIIRRQSLNSRWQFLSLCVASLTCCHFEYVIIKTKVDINFFLHGSLGR